MLTATSTMSSDNYDATFDEELQIDMKGPVGDAVGNVSTLVLLNYVNAY